MHTMQDTPASQAHKPATLAAFPQGMAQSTIKLRLACGAAAVGVPSSCCCEHKQICSSCSHQFLHNPLLRIGYTNLRAASSGGPTACTVHERAPTAAGHLHLAAPLAVGLHASIPQPVQPGHEPAFRLHCNCTAGWNTSPSAWTSGASGLQIAGHTQRWPPT